MSDRPPFPPVEAEVLTLAEAAALLRVSPSQARRMMAEGRLPFFRTGPGPKAPIRVWRRDLERAAEDNFRPLAREDRAREAEERIRALFEADRCLATTPPPLARPDEPE